MPEQWRDIPGYEGQYSVSDLGRIRSYSRKVRCKGGWRVFAPAVLRAIKTDRGYMMTNLSVDGLRKQMPVHRAVLLAFHGTPPTGYEACHNNGIRDDNRMANLRWDTRHNNHADKRRHGSQRGENTYNAKLNDDVVRGLRSGSLSVRDVMRQYGVSEATAGHAKCGRTWAHVS